MVMVGHQKRLSEPLRWTRGGRFAVAAVAALAVAGGIALGVSATGGAGGSAAGCIDVTFASTVGGASVNACGAKARAICSHPAQNPALAAHGRLRDACMRASLPYGAAAGAD